MSSGGGEGVGFLVWDSALLKKLAFVLPPCTASLVF